MPHVGTAVGDDLVDGHGLELLVLQLESRLSERSAKCEMRRKIIPSAAYGASVPRAEHFGVRVSTRRLCAVRRLSSAACRQDRTAAWCQLQQAIGILAMLGANLTVSTGGLVLEAISGRALPRVCTYGVLELVVF